ncbi:hypothetical protein H2198_002052 [Neophaeococcomyces mojaviensis]|uniref:Uncharacterized protein n=1 Tax=Neophaeococcomyces mojaviensis TaxID=3383035 RepID=A0ACC3AFE2_9EURO|nr:hypothetical protein H2198_002052 [Knufia sp. JES_112]
MSDSTSVEDPKDQGVFTYDPLQQDGDQASIRLIKIEPELHDTGLVQVRIKHSTVAANYSAISYIWGEQAERHRILINNCITTVGSNLHKHLCSLRTFERCQWFWVDALSINQQNAAERSQQVKLMAEIFEGAKDVLAFIPLNPGYRVPPEPPFQTLVTQSELYVQPEELAKPTTAASAGSARVAESVSQTDCEAANIGNFAAMTPRDTEAQSARRTDAHAFGALNVAATAICQSRYWHRTWIIQEVALARKLYLTDGQNKISWNHFFELIDVLHNFHQQGALRFIVPHALTRLQDVRKGTRRSTLAALVFDFSSSQCSDFHDKVYGLLSMLQNGHRYPVDYNTNELEFFLSALRFGQGPGADFDAEAQAFVLARTLFRSLYLEAGTIVEQAKAASEMPYIRCRASRLPLKRSSGRSSQSYTCPSCSYKTPDFDTLVFNTIYCLDMDGSHQHLISEESDSLEERQKDPSHQVQMALVIMVQEARHWSGTRIEELLDWDSLSPFRFWSAESLDAPDRHQVYARCHLLEQKTHTPKPSSNGLFYEIDLPVPVFVSMSVRETNDVEKLVGRYTMIGARPDS